MAKKQEFEHESIQDNHSISKYLQALIDGFENGKIMFNAEEQQMILYPGELIEFDIKAKKKGDKNKVSLKLTWKDSGGEITADPEFKISTT